MSQLAQQLAAGNFVVTAEVAPPKGIDLAPVLAVAEKLQGVTAVNVTDNQGANMRLCALVLAGELQGRGIEPVLQLTCRDRNRVRCSRTCSAPRPWASRTCWSSRAITASSATIPTPARSSTSMPCNCSTWWPA